MTLAMQSTRDGIAAGRLRQATRAFRLRLAYLQAGGGYTFGPQSAAPAPAKPQPSPASLPTR